MSKTDYIFGFIFLIFIIFIIIFCQYIYEERNPEIIEIKLGVVIQKIEPIEVTITAYSPSPHITNSEPFTMASGKKATPQDLWKLRYIALSRDLMEEYGVEYGDIIYIGYEVQDTMNIRIKNTVDLFLRNLELARKFGKQTREIIILEEE